MKFLIKAAFWLGVVVLLLPSPQNGPKPMANVSTADAIAFLSTAYSDIKGFCARNPDSCVTGAAAVQHFGVKAEYGAQMLHDFISEKIEKDPTLVPPKGSKSQANVNQALKAPASQGTLKAEDLAPAWAAPKG